LPDAPGAAGTIDDVGAGGGAAQPAVSTSPRITNIGIKILSGLFNSLPPFLWTIN
jgi:hypothetical protein